MKRTITALATLFLVVACFCAPLIASAEYVAEADADPVSPTVVSSIYDYGLTIGYWDSEEATFSNWYSLSTLEYSLADSAFGYEDVGVSISSYGDPVDFELHYYPDDPYHVWTFLLDRVVENDPDLDSVYVWRFNDPFVLPDIPSSAFCPVANCTLPFAGDPSVDAFVVYSYDYYDGTGWVHKSYLAPISGDMDVTVNLFPERAESRLLRNLTTTITFEDTYVLDYEIGVFSYGVPYYIGQKTNNLHYTDPVSYSIQQYGVIDGRRITFTNFLGNALGGVFDAPLFMIGDFEFTIGGLLGVCIGMGVLMLVLKKFAGG